MPDIGTLNIIKINIHAIGTEQLEVVIIAAQAVPLSRERHETGNRQS